MTSLHVMSGPDGTLPQIDVRRITVDDAVDALRAGMDDFWKKPSHYVFMCLIYPVAGIILGSWASGGNALQILFPLVSGFALLGPFFALGLYEISRRREQGLDTSWSHVFKVLQSPALPSILLLGVFLLVLFVCWLVAAQLIYAGIFGSEPPASTAGFIAQVLTTGEGWTLIIVGHLVGFIFAAVALMTTVIAFPLLLDRDVGLVAAVQTSARAVLANPVPMAAWGLIVALALIAGSIPLFAGLALALPVLGHATWHLYRKVVPRADMP